MLLHQLLLLAITHNGVGIIKPWVNSMTRFMNTQRLSLKDFKESQEI